MTHEQTDPRVRRTHQVLQAALIDLAAERGFDAITVGDIARRSSVNRATFYRHYQDKYDLWRGIRCLSKRKSFWITLSPG
jgi:AcrR family transcriptional regulator